MHGPDRTVDAAWGGIGKRGLAPRPCLQPASALPCAGSALLRATATSTGKDIVAADTSPDYIRAQPKAGFR